MSVTRQYLNAPWAEKVVGLILNDHACSVSLTRFDFKADNEILPKEFIIKVKDTCVPDKVLTFFHGSKKFLHRPLTAEMLTLRLS
jgi:hypothetical protein